MTLEEQVLEKLRGLPLHSQKEVLAFVSRLQENSAQLPKRSLRGLWNGLKIDLSDRDIEEARRAMWRGFPRDLT